jgi:hypothetical protein
LVLLLLCGTAHASEAPGELEKRVQATERKTNDLRERLQTIERDEGCMKTTDEATWEQFFNDLDRHNGDQPL